QELDRRPHLAGDEHDRGGRILQLLGILTKALDRRERCGPAPEGPNPTVTPPSEFPRVPQDEPLFHPPQAPQSDSHSGHESPPIDRISPTRRPRRQPILRQNWRELLFLHWAIDPDQ